MRSLTLRYLSISLRMKLHSAKERNGTHSDFQFLWGWNTRYQRNWSWRLGNFQFLWGWNSIPIECQKHQYPYLFQFLWGWNTAVLLNVVSSQLVTFNSFEDETIRKSGVWHVDMRLSIPLRMKRVGYRISSNVSLSFQFLWGWNRQRMPQVEQYHFAFNSFEDETSIMEVAGVSTSKMSFQFLWGWNAMSLVYTRNK